MSWLFWILIAMLLAFCVFSTISSFGEELMPTTLLTLVALLIYKVLLGREPKQK